MTLKITRGLPYAYRWRVKDGKNIWPTINDFEVRSQLRETKQNTSPLIMNLHDYMTTTYGVDAQSNDIIIDFRMTGAETRLIEETGYFDIVLSDTGVSDERAIKIGPEQIKLSDLVTLPEGDA